MSWTSLQLATDTSNITSLYQVQLEASRKRRRRRTGEMTEAGVRKVPEASEAGVVGAALEDEE